MKQRIGDLVAEAKEGGFDVIVHGCNCHHNMGAGIALTIKQCFPTAWQADLRSGPPTADKMGTLTVSEEEECIVVNAYTQFFPGKPREDHDLDSSTARYRAISEALTKVNEIYAGMKVGLPLIGCGLAGLDWLTVREIISMTMTDVDVTVVHWIGDAIPRGTSMGNKLLLANNTLFIKETGEEYNSSTRKKLKCSKCNCLPSPEGHDACIANLKEVKFACCGHGNKDQAYIMYENGDTIRYDAALAEFRKRGVGPDKFS